MGQEQGWFHAVDLREAWGDPRRRFVTLPADAGTLEVEFQSVPGYGRVRPAILVSDPDSIAILAILSKDGRAAEIVPRGGVCRPRTHAELGRFFVGYYPTINPPKNK